jgi:RNA-splicing ligase RtcB
MAKLKKKLYLVETTSSFRHRYVVEADSMKAAEDEVTSERAVEWQQKHIGESIDGVKVVTLRQLKTGHYRKANKTDGSYWLPVEFFIHKGY